MGKKRVKILVLSGGGAHTTTYLGIWQFIHEKIYGNNGVDERYIPDYIVGTSGGALFGCFMAARKNGRLLNGKEIKDELIKQKPWKLVRGKPILKAISLLTGWGLVDIERVRKRIKGVLNKYNINWDTFTKPKYECVVTNLIHGEREYINGSGEPAMDLDIALSASIAVPGVFKPVEYCRGGETYYYVDGGVCEGFPVRAALKLNKNSKIMALSPFGKPGYHKIDTGMDYVLALFHTLLHSKQEDMEELLRKKRGDFHLVTGSFAFNMLDFSISTINKNFQLGYRVAEDNEEKIDEFFIEDG